MNLFVDSALTCCPGYMPLHVPTLFSKKEEDFMTKGEKFKPENIVVLDGGAR
jgi:hypothetical protein